MTSNGQAICNLMVNIIKSRDATTGRHIVRTAKIVNILVRLMWHAGIYRDELVEWDLDVLSSSALLHDIGKIGISDLILHKPDRLSCTEYEVMKTHAIIGEHLINGSLAQIGPNPLLEHARNFAGAHHERWDGGGYPRGLAKADIPLEARILAPADVYDALTSDRPYRKTNRSHADAVKIITEGSGRQFDATIVGAFQSAAYFIGKI